VIIIVVVIEIVFSRQLFFRTMPRAQRDDALPTFRLHALNRFPFDCYKLGIFGLGQPDIFDMLHDGLHQRLRTLTANGRNPVHRALPAKDFNNMLAARFRFVVINQIALVQYQPAFAQRQRRAEQIELIDNGHCIVSRIAFVKRCNVDQMQQ